MMYRFWKNKSQDGSALVGTLALVGIISIGGIVGQKMLNNDLRARELVLNSKAMQLVRDQILETYVHPSVLPTLPGLPKNLADCLKASGGTCVDMDTYSNFELRNHRNQVLAGTPNIPAEYDRLGARCVDSCALQAKIEYRASCKDDTPTCAVANRVDIKLVIEKDDQTFAFEKAVGLMSCNSSEVMIGVSAVGTPICGAIPPPIHGVKGDKGDPGPRGDKGPIGDSPKGDTGPVGPAGPNGVPGGRGLRGPDGPVGLVGLRGNRGARGAVGPKGPDGPMGSVRWRFVNPVVAVTTAINAGYGAEVNFWGIPPWNTGAAMQFDAATATKICNLAGFPVAEMRQAFSPWFGRSGWDTPHNNTLYRWDGTRFIGARATDVGNLWLGQVVCFKP